MKLRRLKKNLPKQNGVRLLVMQRKIESRLLRKKRWKGYD